MSILIKGTNIEDLQRAMLMFSGHEIVELPDHGDLIERDALKEDMAEKYDCETWVGIDEAIKCADAAPVVIPAEREIDKWWERSETVNAERSEDGEA